MVKSSSSDNVTIGAGNWTTFSKRSGQRRSGKIRAEKSVNNNQKPDLWRKSFTPEEEELVIQLHSAIGSRWMIIAQQLPGRTENEVKMVWNTKLRKRLSAMGIDPVTHRPFSQILADYGNIDAFPKARTRFPTQRNTTEYRTPPIAPPSPLQPGLYSQLQVINLFTRATAAKAESMKEEEQNIVQERPLSSDSQEISSFSWRDFLIDEAPAPAPAPEYVEAKERFGGDEMKNGGILSEFEACCSCSNTSAFVDAMIERSQDQFLTVFPTLSEESFHY